ncbi:MAG: secretion protein HlyD, partial [Leptolyngbya sp. ERB_1_2]
AKAELKQFTLKAPVDGVVSSLNIRNRGEVVQPGQSVTEITPKTAPLVLVAALPTREAGFVKVGDAVQVKFDAYPYQDYGIVTGKVTKLSPDIKVDERMGAVYRVEVALDRQSIATKAQRTRFKAGQTATAEIIVRRRTIAEMLLDPIRQLQKGGLSL